MKLYRVEIANDIINGVFNPYIPKIVALDEDETIKRVCLSRSIEGAINSAPWGGSDFETQFPNGFSKSFLLRVYEFEVDEDDYYLITPKELYSSGLVPDAHLTDEYWYLEEILAIDHYLIEVSSDYGETIEDNISFLDSIKVKQEDGDIEDYILGSFTILKDLKWEKVEDKYFTKFINVWFEDENKEVLIRRKETLEEIFGYSSSTYLYIEDNKLLGKIDLRQKSINSNRVNEFLDSL